VKQRRKLQSRMLHVFPASSVQWSSWVWERLAFTAAGIHFDYTCECCGATFFDADVIREMILPKKRVHCATRGYGLGVELDEAKVDSMRV
jgi:hypothetical protein